MDLAHYSAASEFINNGDPDVAAFAKKVTAGAADAVARAVKLYNAVRDEIAYDPYYAGEARSFFRASDCLHAKRGFCIPKAALLAATARSVGIPARVGYADVRNHLSTKKLIELLGSDLFRWHSFTELHLEDSWVKATVFVRGDLFPHSGINTGKVIDFHLLLAELIKRCRAWTSKGIVVQEDIAVKKVNFGDGRFGDEIEYVAPGPLQGATQ